jgi:hypothetical protein
MTELVLESTKPLFEPRQARRIRWCSLLAAFACASHLFTAIILFGWYYWIVPRQKYELEGYGYNLTPQSYFVFGISDVIIVGVLVLVVIAPVTLIIDFITTRWIARHIGLRSASLFALSLVLLMLANMVIGHFILADAKAQVLKQIAVNGPSPQARPSDE